jgi:hypothetical protein
MAILSFPQQQLLGVSYNAQCNPSDMADLAEGGDCTRAEQPVRRNVAGQHQPDVDLRGRGPRAGGPEHPRPVQR